MTRPTAAKGKFPYSHVSCAEWFLSKDRPVFFEKLERGKIVVRDEH